MMDFLLKLAVVFVVLISGIDASCRFQKHKMRNPREKIQGCWHEDELHAFHTMWESDNCEECSCQLKGIECCDYNKMAVGFNPKACVAFFIKESCSFVVVRKRRPTVKCPFKTVARNSESSDSSDSSKTSEDTTENPTSSPVPVLESLDDLFTEGILGNETLFGDNKIFDHEKEIDTPDLVTKQLLAR